jgi:hypothetical protein
VGGSKWRRGSEGGAGWMGWLAGQPSGRRPGRQGRGGSCKCQHPEFGCSFSSAIAAVRASARHFAGTEYVRVGADSVPAKKVAV